MILDCELEEGENNTVAFVNNVMKENPHLSDGEILNLTMRNYRCNGFEAQRALNTVV